MKRALVTVIALAAFAAPAQALAAPMLAAPLPGAKPAQAGTTTTTTTTPAKLTLNQVANRRALNAYASYLTTLVTQEATGQTNDSSYITTISGQCKAALEPLTQPPDEVDSKAQHTLTVLGQEIGDDLTIAFDLPATQAFTRFSGVLKAQHWTRLSGATLVSKRSINDESSVLALEASNLCIDASDAELRPDLVPDGTKTFLPIYEQTSSRANAALTSLMTLMQTYEIPSERALVARISTLASELSTQSKADLMQSGTDLSTVLESN
jgi:hypothetical protein